MIEGQGAGCTLSGLTALRLSCRYHLGSRRCGL